MHWNISASRLSAYRRILSFGSGVRQAMFRARTYIAGRPQLDAFVKQSFARVPLLDRWLRAAMRREREDRYQAIPVRPTRIRAADLTPRALQVYLDLMKALKHGQ